MTFCIKKPTIIQIENTKRLKVLLESDYLFYQMIEFDKCPLGKDKNE